MKHLKLYERRNFKDYLKYNNTIKEKLGEFIKIHKNTIYEEDGEIIIELKTWYDISSDFIYHMKSEIGDVSWRISPANGSQSIIFLYDIPKSYLNKLDVEIEMKRFNL